MAEKKKDTVKEGGFAIPKENYKFMLIGFAIVICGFLLMMGGHSNDPKVFNKEMFNTQRIIIAPTLVILGFIFEVWAIMRKPSEQ